MRVTASRHRVAKIAVQIEEGVPQMLAAAGDGVPIVGIIEVADIVQGAHEHGLRNVAVLKRLHEVGAEVDVVIKLFEVLIDGDQLAELMIDHGLGVVTTKSYELKEVSNDFFDESEG